MPLAYAELDLLSPCKGCGSPRYWLTDDGWVCERCVPPTSDNVIRVELGNANTLIH